MEEDKEWVQRWENYDAERSEDTKNPEETQMPSPLSDFLKENSELFTILGVFAAVSFYFVRFEAVPKEQVELGLVSSLVIFIIVSIVTIDKIFDEASYAVNVDSGFHAATYFVLASSFFGLIVSIYNAIQFYSPTVDPTLTLFASGAIGVFYTVSVFADERIVEIDGWEGFELMVDYAPHLAALLGILWFGLTIPNGEPPVEAADGNILALTFAIILLHMFLIFMVVGMATVGEKLRKSLSDGLSKL
jgi:hypothetical protein